MSRLRESDMMPEPTKHDILALRIALKESTELLNARAVMIFGDNDEYKKLRDQIYKNIELI